MPPCGQPSLGLPSCAFLEFYSFPFLRFFSVCLFFIIFQHKEKESTQQMGILQEVRILFFLSCPWGWGGPSLSLGTPSPQPVPHPVFHVQCCLGRLCLRLTMLHCLHAPEAGVCQGLGFHVLWPFTHRLVRWNRNKPLHEDTATQPRRFLHRACLSAQSSSHAILSIPLSL